MLGANAFYRQMGSTFFEFHGYIHERSHTLSWIIFKFGYRKEGGTGYRLFSSFQQGRYLFMESFDLLSPWLA